MHSVRRFAVRLCLQSTALILGLTLLHPALPRAAKGEPPPATASTTAPTPSPLATKLAEFKSQLNELYERHTEAATVATLEGGRADAEAELRKAKAELAERAVASAESSGPSAATGGLLVFVLDELPETPSASRAANLLAKTYPQRAFEFAPQLAVRPRLWSEAFFRKLLEGELPPKKRVAVELCLAMHQRALLFLHDEALAPFPFALEELERTHGTEFLANLKKLDGEALASEATERFEKLRSEHGETKVAGQTVAEHADGSIRAIRSFRLGMPAPRMIGKDLEGAPLRLSDSRGKVVLLAFWASWCEPCIAEMAHERELRERLGADDFELVGVCLDEEVETARQTAKDQGAAWRSFADVDQSLGEAWFALQLPSYAVVDRDGTLQARGVTLNRAQRIVEFLIAKQDATTD